MGRKGKIDGLPPATQIGGRGLGNRRRFGGHGREEGQLKGRGGASGDDEMSVICTLAWPGSETRWSASVGPCRPAVARGGPQLRGVGKPRRPTPNYKTMKPLLVREAKELCAPRGLPNARCVTGRGRPRDKLIT